MKGDWVLGVDVGGTTMKGVVMHRGGEVGSVEATPTRREQGPVAVVRSIVEFAAELAANLRDREGDGALAGVGIGVPGLVDEKAGIAVQSANLGWKRVPIRDQVEQRIGVPAVVGHDVRLAALAEGIAGAAVGARDYLFVAVGTGIGAAVVIAGEPYSGAHGAGGELGHMVVDPGGPLCGCGKRGCVEAIASASALERRYAEQSGRGDADVTFSARDIVARASKGDRSAAKVWDDATEALGLALANYAVLLDPELVVIGGGVAEAGADLFEPLRKAVGSGLVFGNLPRLTAAALSDAGCRGAAFHALLGLGVPRQELLAPRTPP